MEKEIYSKILLETILNNTMERKMKEIRFCLETANDFSEEGYDLEIVKMYRNFAETESIQIVMIREQLDKMKG